MQPDQAGLIGMETGRSSLDADRFAVGSRRRALDRLRAAVQGGPRGPFLMTGEAGAGKTWLVRRLAEGLPAGWRAAEVELTAALDGLELLRLIGEDLGLEIPDRLGAAHLTLGAGLQEDLADGRSWLLIVDAAERATAGAWDEIRVLSNRIGRARGFAAIILLGRTHLARELAARHGDGWSNRLGLHIHLPPLDLDETRQLPGLKGRIHDQELEVLHRDALGNPRAMLRISEARNWSPGPIAAESPPAGRRAASPRRSRSVPRVEPVDGEPTPTGVGVLAPGHDPAAPRLPSLIPSRPPIRLEDGLVEVGWEGDLEAEPTRPELAPGDTAVESVGESKPSEELVEDRYAALQAWAEWSRNRDRSALAEVDPASEDASTEPDDRDAPASRPAEAPRGDSGSRPASSVRAETSHDFAPYSQLFTRLRHAL
jgi:general secretion pathway protein A